MSKGCGGLAFKSSFIAVAFGGARASVPISCCRSSSAAPAPAASANLSIVSPEIMIAFGFSAEFDVERYYRDAPLMVVGEGTNDIQRNVIIRQLVDRYTGQERAQWP